MAVLCLDVSARGGGGNLLSSGTLDRDKGLKLNDEIVGGVPPRHAGHHQISINIATSVMIMGK